MNLKTHSLLSTYYALCDQNKIKTDPRQVAALEIMEPILDALIHEQLQRAKLYALLRRPQLVKGFYLWGDVGIGKTFLMELFYNALPFKNKIRIHFHAFMQQIHQAMKAQQGKKDPLKVIAKKIAQKSMIICLDELIVNDIADAIVLRNLFQALFQQGVAIVMTSNIAPDDLYKRGLQRMLFLPAIQLIKENMQIIPMVSNIDYRMQFLKETNVFFQPHTAEVEFELIKMFHLIAKGNIIKDGKITIHQRLIKTKYSASNILWFDFKEICQVPRSQIDYIEIAKNYSTVIVSNITPISEMNHNVINLFIKLVDIFYDRQVRFIFSALTPLANIYQKGRFLDVYRRTLSRLNEMQSRKYLATTRS